MLKLNIFQILLLIGFGNSIILLLTFTKLKKKYRKPALFLGLFIVGNLAYQANFVIIPEIQRNVTFIIPSFPVLLFLPALILFFIESALDPDFKITGSRKLFLLPGLADIGYQITSWIYIVNNPEGSIQNFITGRGGHFVHEGAAIIFSMICVYYLLKKFFRADIKKTESYNFFRLVIAGLLIILARWSVIYFVDLFAPGSYNFTLQYYFWLFDSVFLLYTGYKILTAPKILKTDSGGFSLPGGKEMGRYASKLKHLLTEKKLYLNPDLTRKDLAEELDLSEVYISSLLNEGLQSSYYEMINHYRVEEALRLIKSGKLEEITVEALAKEAGFKSKSTFNKTFKEYTGTTPTRYQNVK